MSDAITAQGALFDALPERPVHVHFDQPRTSSDGGAVLLKAVDERLGLTAALGACLKDSRDPSRIRHSMTDRVRQRVFGIAAGYEDCNDAARLAGDPVARVAVHERGCAGEARSSLPHNSRVKDH